MSVSESFSFGHEDRRRIYEYVEGHGMAPPAEAREALRLDPRGFSHHVAILKRDGRLEAVDGSLRVALDPGESEEHRTDGFQVTIRSARQEDLAGLVGAIRQVAGEKTSIVAESVADLIDHEEVLLRHNEIESRMFFVATVGEEVVGWVHLHAPELEKLAHTAQLTVGVLETYRNHGIGSHLLERGLEWAGAHGLEKIYQSVPATNDLAIDFLEGHGWEVEAVRANHYKIGGAYVDEVMMAVTLPDP